MRQIFNASLAVTLFFALASIALAGWDPTKEEKATEAAQEAMSAPKRRGRRVANSSARQAPCDSDWILNYCSLFGGFCNAFIILKP